MSGLVDRHVKGAGRKRGFAVMRLVTHWVEIVGEETAEMAQPVDIGYAREGFGATLTLLTTGAHAPVLQTLLPQIREKVNACYGHNAISRIRITQTAPDGFWTSQSDQTGNSKNPKEPAPEIRKASSSIVGELENQDLKQALERLGASVLSRSTVQTPR